MRRPLLHAVRVVALGVLLGAVLYAGYLTLGMVA